MEISKKDFFFMANGELKAKLTAKKRICKLSYKDKTEEMALEVHELRTIRQFYNEYESTFAIRKGDVLVAKFLGSCGAELLGEHFVVALCDSRKNNPMVIVVPLTSYKGRENFNPASDYLLGYIPGIMNGKQSVAIVNQIQAIDKSRFYDSKVLMRFDNVYAENKVANQDETNMQLKNVYRLTNEQLRDLLKALIGYFFTGFLAHNEID